MSKKRLQSRKFYFICGFIVLIAAVYKQAVDWTTAKFGVTLKEILYTVLSPMDGADTGFLKDAFRVCLPPVILTVLVWIAYSVLDSKIADKISADITLKTKKKNYGFSVFKISKILIVMCLIVSLSVTTVKAQNSLKIVEFVSAYIQRTQIYEDYYVDPNTVSIEAPANKKNLIYIYLESMETTYASTEDGGFQPSENYIPRLTEIANDNISFSNNEKLGGFISVGGTGWTMASLFATTAGVPFSFPVEANSMNSRASFASGITSLGDILNNTGIIPFLTFILQKRTATSPKITSFGGVMKTPTFTK